MAEPSKNNVDSRYNLGVRTIRKRFMLLNRDRLNMTRKALRRHKRVFVDVLPLLFHINHPALPGYTGDDTPTGIADYNPAKPVIKEAEKIGKEFTYKRRAMRVYNIQALYMMGSSGTIAYTEKSDFDIWVCHRRELDDKQIGLLRDKCEKIRKWAESLHLEVTFFIMNIEAFREGKNTELSNESSGSAQHHLLLEEFYRTGMLLAGAYPAWWLVPPDPNVDYHEYLDELIRSRQVREYEYLDFGEISHIPASEFFGAALWQLNKAISSPYKSLLKLLLIESYAAEYPKMELLCNQYKKSVYEGTVDLAALDPYVMMCNKVSQYLLAKGEIDRCELARRCFYFKSNKKLSKVNKKSISPQYELMLKLVDEWNWDDNMLALLDDRSNWKFDRVIREQTTLVRELTHSYRVLSGFARKNASETSIDENDLDLLGRRIYAAFERKAGKVEMINPGISSDLSESRLSFVIRQEGDKVSWLLYNMDVEEAVRDKIAPIKHTKSMIELVAWAFFNQVLSRHSLVTLYSNTTILDSRELLAVIDSFMELYPDQNMRKPDLEHMKEDLHVREAVIYINLGEDPFSSHTRRGVHLTSNRSNALSYGGFWKNLATTFESMIVTNWGEVMTSHFDSPASLMECMVELYGWMPINSDFKAPKVSVYSFSSTRGSAIAKRVEQLFDDVRRVFYENHANENVHYVVNIGKEYYILHVVNSKLQFKRLAGFDELLIELGKPGKSSRRILFDRFTLRRNILPALVRMNKPGKVQMFFEIHDNNQASIWVLDETGALFTQVVHCHSANTLVCQFSKFLQSAIQRCNSIEHTTETAISTVVEYIQVSKNGSGKYQMHRITDNVQDSCNEYLKLQVIGDLSGEPGAVYTLYCDGKEFSSLEFGDALLDQVAAQIMKYRETNEHYPIYITDLEVSRKLISKAEIEALRTVHFLNYKKLIEHKLNLALASGQDSSS